MTITNNKNICNIVIELSIDTQKMNSFLAIEFKTNVLSVHFDFEYAYTNAAFDYT